MSPPRDFVTVDMRGLKASLEALALASGTSVSALVRAAASEKYGFTAPGSAEWVGDVPKIQLGKLVKVSMRMSADDLAALDARVSRLAPSRAAVLAGLLADVPAVQGSNNVSQCLSALIESNAQVATLTRYVVRLCTLLQQGDGVAAREYRDLLQGLAQEVRSHLTLSATVLGNLRPRRRMSHGVQEPPV